ncbi:flagellar protein FlaG [Methanolinea mesophila]|uniref:flagellin n=1 Tax=Methanolinea mesophila TaxID=547055 RepID=UPI001AE332F4|nr:flagellin [Methanolinea mesophila]MBP1927897.1 flagellar protein FlaG [Methanolinea mesophila]
MSSETIVTALFLISAVIAAGVLISAIFPAIYRTADTFGSVSHEADTQMRTDVKIVNGYSATSQDATLWLKNVGTSRISTGELDDGDIFIGQPGNFERQNLQGKYTIEGNGNGFWDPGETLTVQVHSTYLPTTSGDTVYFSIVLSNGVKRSTEFTSG